MEENILRVGYRLVRNAMSTTADKAPFLGVAVPVGSIAYGDILQRMIKKGTFMTRATARYFLNEFYEYAAERIAEDIVRINMGSVAIYPMIGGSFDSEDDVFREQRNTLYVGATLSQEIRDAVSGIVPEGLGVVPVNGAVRISSIMDLASETYRLIDGQKEFRIAGIDLTVPDGEDESLTLVAADGETKASDIVVVSTEDGQRIICTLASAVPAGGYYVRLVSHGLDPTAPLVTALHRVTVKASATPPVTGPVITKAYPTDHSDDEQYLREGEGFVIDGENFSGAEVAYQIRNGATWGEATILDGDSDYTVNESGTSIDIGRECVNGILVDHDLGDTDQVKFNVSNDDGMASVEREVKTA